MPAYGLTKARSLGPIAEAVERAGGSVARAFLRADLPQGLVDEPEQLILLRDQMRLLESAAREIGDDALPARLSIEAGALGLGRLGELCCSQPTLGAAIDCSNRSVAATLQSASLHDIRIANGLAVWTYGLTDPVREGRQKNELLCLGYRLDLMRRFLGRDWCPSHVAVTGGVLDGRAGIADVLGCDVRLGPTTALVFPARLLDAANPVATGLPEEAPDRAIPDGEDLPNVVEALIALDLIEAAPTLDRLCARFGFSRREMQRRLAMENTSFAALRRNAQVCHACARLADPARSVTEIGFELGYADPAHFSRAFRSWTGASPRVWRKMASSVRRIGSIAP